MKYTVYGLVLDSELPLDGVETSDGPPDAVLRFGDTPSQLDSPSVVGPWWEASPGRVLLRVDKIARFLVSDGREILITPLDGSTAAEVAFVLLQGVIGVLLHQRGVLSLHAAAVQIDGRTIAMAGHAGTGKSTLLLECVRRGGRIVTDDLVALAVGPSGPIRINRGFPRAHVWRETLDHFGMPIQGFEQVRSGVEKYRVPAEAADARPELSAVACIEVRQWGDIACERLQGKTAFATLRSYVRGRRITEGLNPAGDFQSLAQVANRVPVFRISRSQSGPSSVARIADQILSLRS